MLGPSRSLRPQSHGIGLVRHHPRAPTLERFSPTIQRLLGEEAGIQLIWGLTGLFWAASLRTSSATTSGICPMRYQGLCHGTNLRILQTAPAGTLRLRTFLRSRASATRRARTPMAAVPAAMAAARAAR